jgi:DNA polymerase
MQVIRLASETDFAGWRAAARRLRRAGTPPESVTWMVTPDEVLLDDGPLPVERTVAKADFAVPRNFLQLAELVVCHRSSDRFARLYALLWRMASEPNLMKIVTDPEVAALTDMARAVSRASHKMKAFVRFRRLEGETPETYAAWFEPPHRVLERTAPFFIERFANMRFSILTPDATLRWDTKTAVFGPGARASDAPGDDVLEDFWRTYYASTFNPARLKVAAMTKEMPKAYWRNLPEASLIPELIASASTRTAQMVEQAPTRPSVRARKAAAKLSRDGSYDDVAQDLEEVVAGLGMCRRCDLWRDATQPVPGEGAARASLMFVGEQPGDQEDLAGKPFVGPAGVLFNRALETAGVPRERTYVTNAVKHFKHEPRGKRRIHQTPTQGEVRACRWWLDAERRLVRPRVIVALGATAALSVFGKPMSIGASRGRAIKLEDQAQGLVTYHPSYLLRVPDEAAKAKAWEAFVGDLKLAWGLAG